jgi:hypothetical protein
MAWAPVGARVVASVIQGPYAVVVDKNSGKSDVIKMGGRGSAGPAVWMPDASAWLMESQESTADGTALRSWYIPKGAGARPTEKGTKRPRAIAARGIILHDDTQAFAAIEERGVIGVDLSPPVVIRDPRGVELMRISPFPKDGADRYVIAADIRQVGGRVVLASVVGRVSRAGDLAESGKLVEPIAGSDIDVVNVLEQKTLCHLPFNDRKVGGAIRMTTFRSIAISPDAKQFAVVGLDGTVVYQIDDCRQQFSLQESEPGAERWIAFSGDGRYLIRAGVDVRESPGGVIDVWRSKDGYHLIHKVGAAFSGLAASPRDAEFAVGQPDGTIIFFRIDN